MAAAERCGRDGAALLAGLFAGSPAAAGRGAAVTRRYAGPDLRLRKAVGTRRGPVRSDHYDDRVLHLDRAVPDRTDRYEDILNDTAPPVGDVNDAGADLTDRRADVVASAEDVAAAKEQVTTAEKDLAEAQAAFAAVSGSASALPSSPAGSPSSSSGAGGQGRCGRRAGRRFVCAGYLGAIHGMERISLPGAEYDHPGV